MVVVVVVVVVVLQLVTWASRGKEHPNPSPISSIRI